MVLTAVLIAAAVSALSIPSGLGVGWLVAVLAGTAALGTATWSYAGSRAATAGTTTGAGVAATTRLGWRRIGWAAATIALVGVGSVRAAGWLFVLCLLTAGVTASLAVVDGRSLRGMALSLVLPPIAVFRSFPWAADGIAGRAIRAEAVDRTRTGSGGTGATAAGIPAGPAGQVRPTGNAAAPTGQARPAGSTPPAGDPAPTGAARPAGEPQFGRVLLTAAVSALLLLVFGALFASADSAFARLLGTVLPDVSAPEVVRWILLFVLVGAGLLGSVYLLARPPDVTGLTAPARRGVRSWEWGVPVALLDALFLTFVLVQATVLFGGGEHVLRTAGLTYADHARGGFWQLLVISGLTLLVISGAVRWAPRVTPADRRLIRLLLGTLALLSLVVVASALYRMEVYTQAYGATRLRLLVFVCELWIGLLFVLVLAAGVRLRARWLPGIAVASAVLALLGLAVLNPDRWIAERNVDRYERVQRVDVGYLSRLSADAAPALDRLPAPLRDCALGKIADKLDADEAKGDWRTANLGRSTARRVIADAPVHEPPPADCWSRRSRR